MKLEGKVVNKAALMHTGRVLQAVEIIAQRLNRIENAIGETDG